MQAPQMETNNEDGGGCSTGGGGGGKTSFLCRQSSTRWSPTTDQIRILKELYYNNGVRSPTAEQIQRISAKLRQYGKIEGKNVFYWFQNHKARERQKKRFTVAAATDHFNISMHTTSPGVWKNDDSPLYSNLSCSSSSSSAGLVSVGTVGNYGYGSVAMEKSFRECSINTQNGNGNCNGSMGKNFTWVGINDHYPYSLAYPFLDHQKKINSYTVNNPTIYQTLEEEEDENEDEEEEDEYEIETLPLFPMHGDDVKQLEADHKDSLITATATTHTASLELTLNSYGTTLLNTSPYT